MALIPFLPGFISVLHDDNTAMRANIPRLVARSSSWAADPVGTAVPPRATHRCERASFAFARQGISWSVEASVAARGARTAAPALLRPHFSYCLRHNSDFGRSGRCAPRGRIRFGSSPKPGLWRGRGDAGASLTRDFTD